MRLATPRPGVLPACGGQRRGMVRVLWTRRKGTTGQSVVARSVRGLDNARTRALSSCALGSARARHLRFAVTPPACGPAHYSGRRTRVGRHDDQGHHQDVPWLPQPRRHGRADLPKVLGPCGAAPQPPSAVGVAAADRAWQGEPETEGARGGAPHAGHGGVRDGSGDGAPEALGWGVFGPRCR